MKLLIRMTVISVLGLSLVAPAWGAISAPSDLAISGAFLTGPINGFVQIPDGGHVGSTSRREPTFSQLGIKHNNDYDIAAQVSWNAFSIYGGYQIIRPEGSATLAKQIITHGVIIPAGSRIRAKVKSDWMRFGMMYKFYLLQKRLILAPEMEGNVLFFNYQIPSFIKPRRFNGLMLRFGLYGEYNFNEHFSIDSTLASSVPLSHQNLVNADVRFKYKPLTRGHFLPVFFVGGGYIYIHSQDEQLVTNNIKYKQPFLLAGLEIHFQ